MKAKNMAAIASIQTAPGATVFQLSEFDGNVDTTDGPEETSFSPKRTSHELRMLDAHDKQLDAISSMLKSGHDMSIPLEMHGSGTTNPVKLMWKMMATLKGMAVRPLHLSYRGIGSSSGIAEFVAGNSHFGCAEIPISQDNKVAISGDANNPAVVLQFPLVLGAMSAFHSVPAEYLNSADGLHLTPCVMAKIFSRQITHWNDPEIVALNPTASLPNKGIVMLHRKKGSSTTNFFTKYLHETTQNECPTAWTLGYGAALTSDADVAKYSTVTGRWAADQAVTEGGGGVVTCEGSGQMSSNLASIPFAIGYIDSGHGHADGLSEVKLRNADGNYLDSSEAGDDGVKAAAAAATFPPTSAGDFSGVNMLNRPGPNTWPIVAASYLFVKQDLRSLGETAVAVKAFLEYAMSTEKGYSSSKGGQNFAGDFSFTSLPDSLLTLNNAGIATLQLPEDSQPFQWEWSTDTTVGPQRNTLSCKRANYETFALDSQESSIEAVNDAMEQMAGQLDGAGQAAEQPAGGIAGADSDTVAVVALIIAIVSLLLNIVLLCGSKRGGGSAAACATPAERRYSTHDDGNKP